MRVFQFVVCLLGAVVGAGFASGREIAGFFAQYGALGPALCVLSAGMIAFLALLMMRADERTLDSLRKGVRGVLLAGLMIATDGAMLAAAGDVCALTLPVFYARELGLLLTLALSFALARSPIKWLALPGMLLFPMLTLALILVQGPGRAAAMPSFSEGVLAVLKALAYAGMNVTLSMSVLCDAGGKLDRRESCRVCAWLLGALSILLLLGERALKSAGSEAIQAPLPFVMLLRTYGLTGFYLAASLLYLASLSTLCVLVRLLLSLDAVKRAPYGGALIFLSLLLAAMLGLSRIVETLYPALGLLCFISLAFLLFRKKPIDK